MNDTCPSCGYCPTCKRANTVNPTVAPNLFTTGYQCASCHAWVRYGWAHACSGQLTWRVTYPGGA